MGLGPDSIQASPLVQIFPKDRCEATGDIAGHEIDPVLVASKFEALVERVHLLRVDIPHLVRIGFDLLSRFHIDEGGGAVLILEIQFMRRIHDMEEQHFMFVVTEVLKG